jgi:hypothetical protein
MDRLSPAGKSEGALQRLVGREKELATLLRGLTELEQGRGSLYLLCGEPGIGKTRLADELMRIAAERGAIVVIGSAWDGGGAPAYWPWIQIVRAVREQGAEPSAALYRDLGPILQDAAATTGDDAQDADLSHFRLSDALRALLHGVAARSRLVVVLDDLHAADRATLLTLQFLVGALRTLPVMIVGTHRDAEVRLEPDLSSLFERIARAGTTVQLAGLGRDAISTWMETLEPVAPTLVDRVFRMSGGNPLFVTEILRLVQSGVPATSELIPGGVRSVVRERLGRFEPEVRAALQAAAVLGRELSLAVLGEVCGLSSRELDERLRSPRLAGVVTDCGEGRQIAFVHPLFRECLYQDLPGSSAARLHLGAGEALLGLGTHDTTAHESAARHLLLALPEGDAVRAIREALIAARNTRRALAFDRAVELLEGALSALAGTNLDEGTRVDVEIELAQALVLSGAGERGRGMCAVAARRARHLSDGPRLARAALAYGAEIRVAVIDPLQLELLDESLALLGDREPELRARVMARLAAARQPAENPDEPVALAVSAIELARCTGDADTLLQTLFAGGAALAGYASPAESRKISRELVSQALAARDLVLAQRGYQRWAIAASDLGDFEELDVAIKSHERLGEALGHPRFRWQSALLHSMRALTEGRWRDSASAIEEAETLVRSSNDPVAEVTLGIHRLGAQRLQMSATREELTRLVTELPVTRWNDFMDRVMTASVFARLGDRDRARRLLAELTPLPERVFRFPIGLLALADAAIRVDDVDLVSRLLPAIEALPFPASSFGAMGFTWEGLTVNVIGGARAVLGNWDEAEEALGTAVATADLLGARPHGVESRIGLASMLLRRRGPEDRPRAEGLLAEADATADELGMRWGRARIAELRSLTEKPGPQRRRPAVAEPAFTLTREGEIWAVEKGGRIVRLKHSRAVELLEQLVLNPEREFHVLDLGVPDDPAALIDRGDSGEPLDRTAKLAYEERVRDLRAELAEAEAFRDASRRLRAKAELEFLEEELSRSFGLGGRPRRSAGAAERARVNVQKRLRGLIRKIAETLPDLGEHLEKAIKTGIFVSYRP